VREQTVSNESNPIGQMNRRAIELVELLRKTNEKKKLSFKIKEIQQKNYYCMYVLYKKNVLLYFS